MLRYLKYFFYLGWNWNWSIAWYIIRQEIHGEKKFNINTTGADELARLKQSGQDTSHATMYMPITYLQLEEIFELLPASRYRHFMDIGCGKGRALCVAAYRGYESVTGVDFSREFCTAALENLRRTAIVFPRLRYTVIHADAAQTPVPPTVDCIFFFNPFDQHIMQLVVERINESLQTTPRLLSIVYANPLYKKLFLDSGFAEIHHSLQKNYLEFSILQKERPVGRS